MTQSKPLRTITPHQAVKQAVTALRKKQGWTADELATECERLGMPSLNRSVIANIESGRRKYVSIDELCCLAFALDVAPVHLLIPIGDEEVDFYSATPQAMLPIRKARQWVRGEWVPPGRDPRLYFANVPAEEFEVIKAADTGKARRDLEHRLEGKSPKRYDDAEG
ncbi:helix-turn-helix domain-containing protein [Nocardia sp. NBC_00403]|uniref:helix-turn-helix domain-containing protein n=1 Tax=Nocardia sp. NBC_00403 TaxID=2975990 RepID=UPI002E23679B